MKNLLLILLCLFVFAGCTKEGPTGPKGSAGEMGRDGRDGHDGRDGIQGEAGLPGMRLIQEYSGPIEDDIAFRVHTDVIQNRRGNTYVVVYVVSGNRWTPLSGMDAVQISWEEGDVIILGQLMHYDYTVQVFGF
jgi:hypothetical protein